VKGPVSRPVAIHHSVHDSYNCFALKGLTSQRASVFLHVDVCDEEAAEVVCWLIVAGDCITVHV